MDLGGPPRLFTVGSIVADIRLEAPHLPVRGGDVIASSARISAGGGFNILCAAARQGLRCVFAGRHGAGPYGERIRADCSAKASASSTGARPKATAAFASFWSSRTASEPSSPAPASRPVSPGGASPDVPLAPGDTVFASGYDLAYPELGPAIAAWMAEAPRSVRFVVDPGPLAADIPGNVDGARHASRLGLGDEPARSGTDRRNDRTRRCPRPHAARPRARRRAVLRDGPRGAWTPEPARAKRRAEFQRRPSPQSTPPAPVTPIAEP